MQSSNKAFLFVLRALCGMQDLSSLTRSQTHSLCNGRQSLNQWTTREVPSLTINYYETLFLGSGLVLSHSKACSLWQPE